VHTSNTVLARTNYSQAIETDNNIYGRTTNPYNRKLGAGGSSGGEGALIAMRGSPLGVGTDIAGSIRLVLPPNPVGWLVMFLGSQHYGTVYTVSNLL